MELRWTLLRERERDSGSSLQTLGIWIAALRTLRRGASFFLAESLIWSVQYCIIGDQTHQHHISYRIKSHPSIFHGRRSGTRKWGPRALASRARLSSSRVNCLPMKCLAEANETQQWASNYQQTLDTHGATESCNTRSTSTVVTVHYSTILIHIRLARRILISAYSLYESDISELFLKKIDVTSSKKNLLTFTESTSIVQYTTSFVYYIVL